MLPISYKLSFKKIGMFLNILMIDIFFLAQGYLLQSVFHYI